jgi:hypothetical protein
MMLKVVKVVAKVWAAVAFVLGGTTLLCLADDSINGKTDKKKEEDPS